MTTLTEEQKSFYARNGYLLGLPRIYSAEEMEAMNAELPPFARSVGTGRNRKGYSRVAVKRAELSIGADEFVVGCMTEIA